MKGFHNYRLDTRTHSLWKAGERIRIAPKAFDVLRFLVDNAGRLLSHDLLLDTIWPETYVNPEIIRKYILEVRKALGDSCKDPIFIETHAKRGYRFIAPVEDLCTIRQDPDRSGIARSISPVSAVGQTVTRSNGPHTRHQLVVVTGEAGSDARPSIKLVPRRVINTKLAKVLSAIGEALTTVSDMQICIFVVEDMDSIDPVVLQTAFH